MIQAMRVVIVNGKEKEMEALIQAASDNVLELLDSVVVRLRAPVSIF